MRVSADIWLDYVDKMHKVNTAAGNLVSAKLTELGGAVNITDPTELLQYSYGVATAYGEAATAVACEMYDAVSLASGMRFAPAEPAETASYHEVAKSVVGTLKTGNDEIVAGSVERLVKMAGVDTTMKNTIRDGGEWAWIPMGTTCAFCLMLASNGWQRASASYLKDGHAEHIHPHCDCMFAVRFDSVTEYEGYNPTLYKRIYASADGRTSKQKLNSMRREFYAENSEMINEQKRDAYEKRKEREASAAEEMKVRN